MQPAPLGGTPLVDLPFKNLAVGIVGALTRIQRKNAYNLLWLTHPQQTQKQWHSLPFDNRHEANAIFSHVSFPEVFLSDHGTQFTGKLMKEVLELLRIQHVTTPTYQPACNGMVEWCAYKYAMETGR